MNSSLIRIVGTAAVMLAILLVLYFSISSVKNRNAGQKAIFDQDLSLSEARRIARNQDKDVFVLALATWCPFCAELDRSALADSDVQDAISENAIPVRVDISGRSLDPDKWPDLDKLNIKSVPTLILIGKNGRERDRISGVVDAKSLERWIRSHGEDKPEIIGGQGQLEDS